MENKEKTISLADIWHAIWKNKIIILCITVAVTILGAIYTFALATPKYQSEAHVVVAISTSGDEVDYTNSLRAVETIGDVVYESCVLDPVAKKHDIKSEDLKSMISSTVGDMNFIVTISVTCSDKDLAKTLADEVTNQLIDVTKTNTAIKTLKCELSKTSEASNAIYKSPNKKLYLLVSVVLGLVLSLVVAFIKEFMSTNFKTKDEVEALLDTKILGTFHDIGIKKKDIIEKQFKLVDPANPRDMEEYNTLLSNLKYMNLENPYKVLTITSTGENELKSTTICNLAIAMVKNNKKVILVDLDLKRPTLHKAFGLPKSGGMVEYVAEEVSKGDAIHHTDMGIDVICAGTTTINTLAVIESNHLKELIESLKEEYDYILLDTTPLVVSNDALIVSGMSDGVIYNVSMNQTKKNITKEKIALLRDLKINMIGACVNKIPKNDKGNYYYSEYKALEE